MRRQSDDGFTLIEVLIALVLSGVIVAALGTAFSVGASNSKRTSQRLALSHDAEASARWFARDASSSARNGVSLAPNTCVSGSGATPVVSFTWPENAADSGAAPPSGPLFT